MHKRLWHRSYPRRSRQTISLVLTAILTKSFEVPAIGDYWQGADWLFVQDNGKQMSYYTPYSAFRDALDRYNAGMKPSKQLPLISFHGLRHTSATLLIAGKQDAKTVAARLGHAQTSTTMNIYVHALKENDSKAVDAIENVLTKQA